jgi:hypothetical protein
MCNLLKYAETKCTALEFSVKTFYLKHHRDILQASNHLFGLQSTCLVLSI